MSFKLGTDAEVIQTKSADYTVGPLDDLVNVSASGAQRAITLNAQSNEIVAIRKTDSSSNSVVVTATINGAANYSLTAQNQCAIFRRTKTGVWYCIEDNSANAVASELNALAAAIPTTLISALTDNSGGAAADGTIGAVTAPAAITDSSGGVDPGNNTVAAVTNPDLSAWNGSTDPSATQATAIGAAFTAVKAAVAQLAAKQNVDRTAIVALTDAVKELSTISNTIVSQLKTAGIVASS